jgi:hypothetical protein
MSVSEDACKKVFTKLTGNKKVTGQASAKAKTVKNAIVQTLSLVDDGSDVVDELIDATDVNSL